MHAALSSIFSHIQRLCAQTQTRRLRQVNTAAALILRDDHDDHDEGKGRRPRLSAEQQLPPPVASVHVPASTFWRQKFILGLRAVTPPSPPLSPPSLPPPSSPLLPPAMSNDSSFLSVWEASDWADTSQCPPSVGGATFLIVAYSAVIAIGLLGNAGLVFIIARQQELRNVTNILIANLSCSDILMCVVCLPVTVIYTLMDRWVLGEALCKVTPFVQCMSVTVSVFSLVLIALERHQLILHPTGWSPAAGHSYLAVGLTWLVACFISLPFLSFNILTNDPFQNISLPTNPFRDHLICMELWPSDKHRLAYTTSLLLFQYCLPLLLVLLCYLRIFLRLRRRRDMVERSRRTQGAHRINVMLLVIVVAFALCWLPLNVFNTLFDWHHQVLPDCQHDAIFSACHLTAMASTCINPVVYGFLNSNFQRELKATLQRCQCGGAAAESYESFPLSTVGSEGITKATSLNRMGSVCVPSPRFEMSSARPGKTIPTIT